MKPKYICLFFLLIIIFFIIFIYNFSRNGNNINRKSNEEIVNCFICMKNYKIKAKFIVFSNKTVNEYELELNENLNEKFSEIKIWNKDASLLIQSKDDTVLLRNEKLKLEKEYSKEDSLMDNYLFFNNMNIGCIYTKDNKIVVEDKSTKIHNRKLYIDKERKMLDKMEIIDDEQNIKAIIEYKELELK